MGFITFGSDKQPPDKKAVTGFTEEYWNEWEVVEESFTDRALALKRAKELRKQGFEIKVTKSYNSELRPGPTTHWEIYGRRKRVR